MGENVYRFGEVVADFRRAEVRRGGESRYSINGKQVRLLDLEEFLARSRVGASSFRILSQGMSDMLIKLGPQELRSFVEEAAGLKEFQDKKQRSLKKIEHTRDNLERVRELLAEIAPQLRFLKREAGKIARREEIEKELKEKAAALFGFRAQKLAEREKRVAEKRKKYERTLQGLEKEVQELEQEFSRRTKDTQNGGGENNLQKLRSKDHELARQIIRLEGQLEVEKERSNALRPVTQDYLKGVLRELMGKIQDYKKEGSHADGLLHAIEKIEKIIFLKSHSWSSCCGSGEMNLTSIHEDEGSIPGLTQWVTVKLL